MHSTEAVLSAVHGTRTFLQAAQRKPDLARSSYFRLLSATSVSWNEKNTIFQLHCVGTACTAKALPPDEAGRTELTEVRAKAEASSFWICMLCQTARKSGFEFTFLIPFRRPLIVRWPSTIPIACTRSCAAGKAAFWKEYGNSYWYGFCAGLAFELPWKKS